MTKNLNDWDFKLRHAEFAYNRAPSYATKHFLFECVYRVKPLTPIDLLPLPSESRVHHEGKLRATEMKRLYEQIRNRINKTNAAYKTRVNKHRKKLEFNPGNPVWLHLRKIGSHLEERISLCQKGWTIQGHSEGWGKCIKAPIARRYGCFSHLQQWWLKSICGVLFWRPFEFKVKFFWRTGCWCRAWHTRGLLRSNSRPRYQPRSERSRQPDYTQLNSSLVLLFRTRIKHRFGWQDSRSFQDLYGHVLLFGLPNKSIFLDGTQVWPIP